MTPDSGYLTCWFDGPPSVMDAFRAFADHTDRQNQFSCGLSWLDDLDCENEVESESISYDSISATQEFLSELLAQLPEIRFEGRLEHGWPILPCRQTIVEFSSVDGLLAWSERSEELTLDADELDDFFEDEEEDDEIEIPLTPYD